MSYVEWATDKIESSPQLILCVHGLTRNGRDFDYLARDIILEKEKSGKPCIVASIDILGRGESDWLEGPEKYHYSTYVPLVAEFIKFWLTEHGVDTFDYVGTSMGGIIGMMLFTVDQNTAQLIRKLVMNDIGMIVPKEGISRLGTYVAQTPLFDHFDEVIQYCKERYVPFGNLSDEQWRHISKYSVKEEGGKFRVNYDANIGNAFKTIPADDVDFTVFWNAITRPVLLLHGVKSDILTDGVIAKMQKNGPGATNSLTVAHFEDCGHAPSLLVPEQIRCVENYLFD